MRLDRHRLARIAQSVFDQAWLSGINFAISLLLIRTLDKSEYGLYVLLFNTVLAVVQHWWAPGLGEAFAGVAGQAASFTLMTLLFAMIYKIMPRARIAWTDVWIGALVTAGLLTAGRHGIGLLIATSGAAAGYGAAGSLVVLLLWVYYSAQIFLLGAEFTWVYAHALGSHRGTAAVRA